ncbi:uncharacterized protein LOC124272532 isoform X1 [Haliotis rubra]|uniref:uncharacterized protein LOC124272532 isoform X1 n=2 Tax=Haliotis rubra TaxID=36100 RepID=UPI001EE51249|nr:uncharacterized protein LOC124272532 isoform X1 [Haliotis rubra]
MAEVVWQGEVTHSTVLSSVPSDTWSDMSQKPKRKHAAMTAEVVPVPSSVVAAAAAVVAEGGHNDEPSSQPEKKPKREQPSTSKEDLRSPEEITKQLEDTFDIRRSFITIEMPGIPIILETYPDLFTGKNMLLEFQRISKIDIDHTIQEYCVKFAPGIVELAKHTSGSAAILKQADQAKQDNAALKQYWDMVTALCLIPLLLKENIVEMVREIGEEDEVDPRGKVVPILIARGSIFKSDEFFLVAEETVLQEFEEFTMAFATLFSSYWVFNMQYPRTLNNTYNFVQKGILHLRDETPIPPPCKQLVQKLQKWSKIGKGKK